MHDPSSVCTAHGSPGASCCIAGAPSGRRRPGYGEATSHQGRLQVQTYQDGLSSNWQPPAGLEPAIPGSVGRCLVHWATGPFKMQNLRCSFVKWCLENSRRYFRTPPTDYTGVNKCCPSHPWAHRPSVEMLMALLPLDHRSFMSTNLLLVLIDVHLRDIIALHH